jgi:hypothetical protein
MDRSKELYQSFPQLQAESVLLRVFSVHRMASGWDIRARTHFIQQLAVYVENVVAQRNRLHLIDYHTLVERA